MRRLDQPVLDRIVEALQEKVVSQPVASFSVAICRPGSVRTGPVTTFRDLVVQVPTSRGSNSAETAGSRPSGSSSSSKFIVGSTAGQFDSEQQQQEQRESERDGSWMIEGRSLESTWKIITIW